ncbi:hypothetical protein J2S11_002338 [Bacillus horti]|uniref:YvrJ family protein n=1 Tax=Caldalkalibacillus horti TaxID=77523 RepID=A0ABT9VZL1_9BACI|nr:hypothetical protein [Bacillus horti]
MGFGWVIIIAIVFSPMFYAINRRLSNMESRLVEVEAELKKLKN